MDDLANYQDLCRVCLDQASSIFTLTDLETKQRFEECTSVRVITDQDFPTKLCAKCHSQLMEWNAFRSQAMYTDQCLQGLVIASCSTKVEPKDSPTRDAELWSVLEEETETAEEEKFESVGVEEDFSSSDDFPSGGSNSQTTEEMAEEFQDHPDESTHFRCEICSKIFPSNAALKRHMKFHRNKRPFECAECHKNFRFPSSLEEHEKSHNPGTQSEEGQCFYCPLKLTNDFELQKHELNHLREMKNAAMEKSGIGGPKNVCPRCNKSYVHPFQMRQHMRASHPEDYKKVQEVKLGTEEELEKLNASKPFTCDICLKVFSFTEHFKAHMAKHTDVLPYKCRICPAAFKNQYNLFSHESSKHPVQKRKQMNSSDRQIGSVIFANFIRQDKFQPFVRLERLEHLKVEEKQNESSEDSLDSDRPLNEFLAGDSTSKTETYHESNSQPNRTLDMSEELPFKCTLCDTAFKCRSDVAIHERIVHAKRQQSDNSEELDDDFDRHINVSLSDASTSETTQENDSLPTLKLSTVIARPFNCKFCTRSFRYKRNVIVHERNVHANHEN